MVLGLVLAMPQGQFASKFQTAHGVEFSYLNILVINNVRVVFHILFVHMDHRFPFKPEMLEEINEF